MQIILGHNTPGELAKCEVLLDINLVAEGVTRDTAIAHAGTHALDKVRNSLEPTSGDALQSLAGLESDAVARDLDLDSLAGARLDVEASLGIGRRGQLIKGWQRGARVTVDDGRHGGAGLLLVDEHGRREAGQAAVVQVGGAPVVLAVGRSGRGVGVLGVVVQQAGLGGGGRGDNALQVGLGVAGDVSLGVAVAGAGDEDGDVDDEAAQAGNGGAEAGQHRLGGPDVGREVLGECLGREVSGGLGALEAGVDVEGAVGVVGALEGVDLAVLERLLAQGPAGTFGAKSVGKMQGHRPETTESAPPTWAYPPFRMVKPLTFKGDKKPKKRKRTDADKDASEAGPSSKQVARTGEDDANADDDDSWVSAEAASDVAGPVMIVLPTDKPSALACDINGKVFTIPIENIVDGNPTSAEPHDVRQVWVANRVAGTDNFRFKGHHGKYLSCDKIGQLSATSEAVSPLESFNIIATADTPGTFQLQTLRDTFITIKTPSKAGSSTAAAVELRGDADLITFNTTLRIRMQARFKPRLKAVKEERALAKISRKELEEAAGRRLTEDEVRVLKRARREGDYHERMLDIKVKYKHDKFG
ncbi:FRG1-like family protein [Paramyrothecium foliicola]|nr:FRG1-like family protein [Paramyrothecium foliicola]